MLKVAITNRQKSLGVDRGLLRRLARLAAPADWDGATLSLVVVGDEEMAALHEEHLGQPGSTDVISFDLDDPGEGEERTVGEVIVCADRAAAEARRRRRPAGDELALYVVHGVLHVAGFDDHDPVMRRRMRRREREVLAAAGIHQGVFV